MTDQPGTLEAVLLEVGRTLGQISNRLSDDSLQDTFAELGVQFPDQLLTNSAFSSARNSISTAAARLISQVQGLQTAIGAGNAEQMISAGVPIIDTLQQLISGFTLLVSALQAAAPTLPGITVQQVTDLVANLPQRLLDLLLYDLLERSRLVGTIAEVLGVIERVYQPGDPANPSKPDYDQITLHLDRLIGALTNPVAALQSLYQWGSPGFDPAAALTVLEGALGALGLPVRLIPAAGPNPVMLQAFALDLRPTTSGTPPGLEVDLVLPASINKTFTFPLSPPNWLATVAAQAALVVDSHGTIRPPLVIEIAPPSGQLNASGTASISAQPPSPVVLLGQTGGSRLEVASVDVSAGATLSWDTASGTASGGPTASGSVTGGKLIIDASEGDGFITTLLGGQTLESDFAVQFAFAPDTGFRFEGSGSLQIQLPVHVSLGPVDISSIYLVATISDSAVPVELSAAMSADLGPLQASVDRLGAIVTVGFPAGGGNAGPAQIDVAFKPPNGVGLSVDAGTVSGGGYLYLDPAQGQYAGALQLQFADFLTLSAIGLIDTKLPDGSAGFSLLIIITADFGAGIQLGFGFTLNAVGGLLGVNRSMLFQPLMDGVRSGAINSVMFPQDVVANAQRVISDLQTFFPPQQGIFLIGPMAKLGWGEPTLVSLSLAVIAEIPPGDIAILGVLSLQLPAEDLALLVLQVNFAGALEFDKQRMYFFASLYDSHILFITIEGQMGLLVAWGDNANFVVTVGGFNPQYNPPPLPFPTPQRISVDIINESYAQIQASGYFAVTTNSVQFGSLAQFFFGFSALSVSGHAGFDALIEFSPFHFSVSISSSFSVQVFGLGVYGIGIDLMLDGPDPWHAHGTASLSFLFFSIGIGIDFTWGDSGTSTLPPVNVMPILAAEFGKQSNWRAMLPAGINLLVTLRQLDPSESQFVLHPAGTLQISQRAIPLDITIDTVGGAQPADANRFGLSVSSADLVQTAVLTEPFAPARFITTDDATKLSESAFVPEDSGIAMAAAGDLYASGTTIVRIVRYDQTIIDTELRRSSSNFEPYSGSEFQNALRGNAAALSELSARQESLTHPFTGTVQVTSEIFAVAQVSDNTAYSPESATFSSRASAVDYLNRLVAASPSAAGTLHVLPHYEVAA